MQRQTNEPPTVERYAAFTDHGRGGNPAGVVLDSRSLSDAQMLEIARNVGYSETAFLSPTNTPGAYDVRYFSPLAEVAFCGHATVAAGVALADAGVGGDLVFGTVGGPVAVTTASVDGEHAATLTSVPTRTRPASDQQLATALRAMRWSAADHDPRYPAHVGYAGNDHLLLAVASRQLLAELDYDYPQLQALMSAEGWTTVHAFWAETPTLFHARDPFPPGGVVEDPATGAAAAAFGGYLRSLELLPVPSRVTILQGHDMGAPSRLLVDLDPEVTTVRVTGTAKPIS
jgi:PhzF family phenazine biosynthesis protein